MPTGEKPLWTRVGFLDLFDYVPGNPQADVADLFSTSAEFAGLGHISREWLAATKLAAGRPQDLIDQKGLGLEQLAIDSTRGDLSKGRTSDGNAVPVAFVGSDAGMAPEQDPEL
jgi:hypothetical protein